MRYYIIWYMVYIHMHVVIQPSYKTGHHTSHLLTILRKHLLFLIASFFLLIVGFSEGIYAISGTTMRTNLNRSYPVIWGSWHVPETWNTFLENIYVVRKPAMFSPTMIYNCWNGIEFQGKLSTARHFSIHTGLLLHI